MNDFEITGVVTASLYDSFGRCIEKRKVTNLVPSLGRVFVRSILLGIPVTPIDFMALGSDGTPPTLLNVLLGSEFAGGGYTRDTVSKVPSTFVTFPSIVYTGFWAGGTFGATIAEVGLFNLSGVDTGSILARAVFNPPFTKGFSNPLTIDWTPLSD